MRRRQHRPLLKPGNGRPRAPSFKGYHPASDTASRVKRRTPRRDTTPELTLRKHLWAAGIRYRLHDPSLPGRPDLILRHLKVAVFCDGDFWHGRNWAALRAKLTRGANPSYWLRKIKANIARDRRTSRALRAQGWTVVRLWESEILSDPDRCVRSVSRAIRHSTYRQGHTSG